MLCRNIQNSGYPLFNETYYKMFFGFFILNTWLIYVIVSFEIATIQYFAYFFEQIQDLFNYYGSRMKNLSLDHVCKRKRGNILGQKCVNPICIQY